MEKFDPIKPCPFCGTSPYAAAWTETMFGIACFPCEFELTRDTGDFLDNRFDLAKEDAIITWNRRQAA